MRRFVVCIALISGISTASLPAHAGPNCANMLAQAGGAAVGLYAQTRQLLDVCAKNGWKSGPCIAQLAVVAQGAVWMWWTSSNYYCACTQNPNQNYCAALGLLPAPPAPPAAPGGGGLAPPGPPPPKPVAQVDNPDTIDAGTVTTAVDATTITTTTTTTTGVE